MAIENKEFEELCNEAGHAIMEPYITQMEYVYIDADLLYDFKLGALMAYIKNEDDYKYIMDQIPAYLKANDLECAKHFPKMGLTEQDLDYVLTSPKYETVMSCIIPRTSFMVDLERLISIIRGINNNKETNRPIRLFINERRYKLGAILKKQLTDHILRLCPDIILEFTNFESWYDVDVRLIEKMDYIGVYDIVEFTKEGTPTQKLLSAVPSGFAKTGIVALAQVNKTYETDEDIEEALTNTANIFSLMCDRFVFLRKSLITKDPTNG